MGGPGSVDGGSRNQGTGGVTGTDGSTPVEPAVDNTAAAQVVDDGVDTNVAPSIQDPRQPPRIAEPPSSNVQRSFALLAGRHSMDPLARSYRHGSVPRANFDAPREVRNAYFNQAFSAEERAQINAYYALPLEERMERAGEIMQLANTPDKVAALLGSKFTWVQEHDGAETWSATEMIATGRGVCRDQHNAAREILQMHGYEAYEVGYADGNANHAVLVFEDKADGKWYLMDYDGLIHPEGATSRRELLEGIDAGNFAWRIYEDTDGRPSAYAEKIWTRAGLLTLGFMHGTESGDQGLSGLNPNRFSLTADEAFDGWRLGAEASDEHLSIRGQRQGRRGEWETELRFFTPRASTTMENAFGAAVRFNPELRGNITDASVSLSFMHLPNRGSRQIGGATRNGTQPLSMVGLAGNLTVRPYQWEAVDDHLFLTGDLDLRAAGALGFNHGTGGIDQSTGELAHADVTWRNQLEYRFNDATDRWGLRAYAGPTVNMDLVQTTAHYISGGRGAPPFNAFFEAGVEGAYQNLALGGRVYLPIESTSNLFREDPAWDIYGGFHHNDFRFLGGVSGSLEGEPIERAMGGVGYKWLSAQGGYDFQTDSPTFMLQASFRF